MAYPGDFVAANRAARTDAQHVSIHPFVPKNRRMFDLRRACFGIWERLAKHTLQRIYSRGSDSTRDKKRPLATMTTPSSTA
jgi:hypothetical protein